MIKYILYIMVAVLVGCGLIITTGCTNKNRQLKAAVESINETCPAPVAEGISFQEVSFVDGDVNMTFAIEEDVITIPVTAASVQEWKAPFVTMFGTMVCNDANVGRLFRLIGDAESTMTLTILMQPSGTAYPIRFSRDDINCILAADKIPVR